MAFVMEVGLGAGHIVLDGDPAPLPKKGAESSIFGLFLLWPNGWMHQDATWYGGRPQPRRLCVRCGPSPLPIKGRSPHFLTMSIVAKRLHGSRCHLVWRKASAQTTLCSMGTQLPPEKRAHPPHPIFGPCLVWPNGWMDQATTWYEGKRRPRRRCGRWGRSSP